MAASLNGVVINEILVDPDREGVVGGVLDLGFDTDGDGLSRDTDEFIELYNTSSNSVDISGWTLEDAAGRTFTFPSGTSIGAEGKVIVATQYNGTLPAGYFEFDSNSAIWNNTGDLVILSDGTQQISAGYDSESANGDDNFGNNEVTESLQRSPDGSDNIVSAEPTPECFLTGTRILTETGYKVVEELQIGDKVQTANGDFADIKWIGYQTIESGSIANVLRGYPILIKASALGDNIPCRDLYVSPDHALLVDGLLINAGALVNDLTIVKTELTETFVYHSIELEHHALLVAEGTQAESYMPHQENRDRYDNGAEYEKLYPQGSNLMLWPMDYPRISSKGKVPRFVNQKLMQIAEQLEEKLVLSA